MVFTFRQSVVRTGAWNTPGIPGSQIRSYPVLKQIMAAVLALALVSTAVYAQAAPAKILTQNDIESFLSNFEQIQNEMEDLGDKYNDLFDSEDFESGVGLAIRSARALRMPAEIQAVFNRNGMGNNGFEKMLVITFAISSIEMQETIEENREMYSGIPEMEEYMKEFEQQILDIRSEIHADDLRLVTANRARLLEMFMNDSSSF